MLVWIFTQSVSFNIMLFGAIYAYNNPQILMNHAWQSKIYRSYHLFVKLQVLVFFAVIFIDPIAFLLPKIGFEFTEFPMTQEEASLDIIVRVSQAMCCIIVLIVGYLMFNHSMDKRKKIKEANRALDGLKNMKRQSYAENRESETPTSAIECSICLGEYAPEDEVLQLNCHPNHIYHRQCI